MRGEGDQTMTEFNTENKHKLASRLFSLSKNDLFTKIELKWLPGLNKLKLSTYLRLISAVSILCVGACT